MRGMKIRALFSAALLLSAVSLTKADEPGLQELQSETVQAEMYMNAMGAVAALAELNSVLIGLESPEDVQAAMPAIDAAVEAYHHSVHALPEECNPPSTPEWDSCFEAWAAQNKALQGICESEEFIGLLGGHEGLMYHLLLHSVYLPVFVEDSTAEYMLMGVTDPDNVRPSVVCTKVAALRAEAAERHSAYLAEHVDEVSGGDGADAANAIVLKSATQKERSAELVEEQGAQIADYVTAVYPQCNRGYTYRLFTPDGASYVVFMIYAGLCADEDGTLYLVNLPIYFQTKAAGL